MDKSYVTMEVCPICKGDTGNILIDRRIKDVFEKRTINPRNTCNKCREIYLKEGVLIINPETVSLVVLKEEAFSRLFNIPIPNGKIVFTHEDVIQQLNKEE